MASKFFTRLKTALESAATVPVASEPPALLGTELQLALVFLQRFATVAAEGDEAEALKVSQEQDTQLMKDIIRTQHLARRYTFIPPGE